MTVTVTRDQAGGTTTLTTTVDGTSLRVSPSLTREAILADIDALKFSGPNPIPMPPVIPSNAWSGTCSPVNLAPGLADIRAYVAALPARSGV